MERWNVGRGGRATVGGGAAWRRLGWAGASALAAIVLGCAASRGSETAARADDDVYVSISLRELSERVTAAIREGRELTEEERHPGGMAAIEGCVRDREAPGDFIVFGRKRPEQPALGLDVLLVGLRNVWGQEQYPYCSLDPTPEGMRRMRQLELDTNEPETMVARIEAAIGEQQIVVGGVPRDSRYAKVMIAADYHMKQVSQGRTKVAGVESALDLALKAAVDKPEAAPPTLSISRFWFHIGEGAPQYEEAEDIIRLSNCAVGLLTQAQLDSVDGHLQDVARDEPQAKAFAAAMTKAFPNLAQTVPEYGELEMLYRLRALLLGMRFRHWASAGSLDLETYLAECEVRVDKPMPAALPGLANAREWQRRTTTAEGYTEIRLVQMVCGGVDQDMVVKERSFSRAKLEHWRSAILAARPSARALAWTVRLAN